MRRIIQNMWLFHRKALLKDDDQLSNSDLDKVQSVPKMKMIKIKKRHVVYSILNVSAISTISVILILIQTGYMPQIRSGFYCNDPDLSFKFAGDTVNVLVLLSGVYFIPLIVMTVGEYINSHIEEKLKFVEHLNKVKKALWKWYGNYNIVLIINFILVSIIKFVYGKPRPHFFDTCKPDSAINCTEGYIQEYKCTNVDYSYNVMIDSYRSFLSGHSSLSVYAGLFTFWYMEKRVKKWCPKFVTIVLQILALSFSIISSLTRITDHRHHWWDVLAGSILGALLTIYAILVYCDNFKCKKRTNDEKWHIQEPNKFRCKDVELCYDNAVPINI